MTDMEIIKNAMALLSKKGESSKMPIGIECLYNLIYLGTTLKVLQGKYEFAKEETIYVKNWYNLIEEIEKNFEVKLNIKDSKFYLYPKWEWESRNNTKKVPKDLNRLWAFIKEIENPEELNWVTEIIWYACEYRIECPKRLHLLLIKEEKKKPWQLKSVESTLNKWKSHKKIVERIKC